MYYVIDGNPSDSNFICYHNQNYKENSTTINEIKYEK